MPAPSSSSAASEALARALTHEDDATLDTAASQLAAVPAAQTAALVEERAADLLAAAWRHGWEPADVARLVHRDLRTPHAALFTRLARAQTGTYPVLDPRWTAQLAALTPAQAPREDRFTAATTALELLRLLLRLPPLEPVGPPPGTAPSAPRPTDDPALARIRALLAKAEATTYPAEAEALSAKAQELMARHRIDEAQLAAGRRDASPAPAACRIGVEQPYGTAKAILLDAVATANRCRAVWNEDLGFSTVVGYGGDLTAVELLHTSLLVQAHTAMSRAEAEARAAGRRRTKTFRQSFLLAYAHHVGARLAEADERVTGAADPALLPVLAARDVAVTAEAERMFPRTRATRVRGASDEAGWRTGTEAAHRARLGEDADARRPARGAGGRRDGGR